MSQNDTVKSTLLFFRINLLFLSFCFVLAANLAEAAPSCRKLFKAQTRFETALSGEATDSFELLIEFENLWNSPEFQRPIETVEIPIVELKKNSLTIEYFGSEEDKQQIEKLLVGAQGRKLWFQHPYNTSSNVPHYNQGRSDSLKGYLSSSRSLFFRLNGKFYSIRMPTNQPRGPMEDTNLAKVNIAPELEIASDNMDHITEVEKLFGTMPELIIAKELAIVKTVSSNNTKGLPTEKSGFLIRNLVFLENKNRYYMPAFALSEVGKMISQKAGKPFSDFWIKKYAEALGVVKAQLLIHYGLQMDFPHGQNILLELNEKMMPTGRFVLRDIDDMSQYSKIVEIINEVLETQGKPQIKINPRNSKSSVDLLWNRHSSRVISKSDDPEVYSKHIYDDWERAHEKAFSKEVSRLLGLKSNDIDKTSVGVQAVINSAWGQGLIRNYFLNFTNNPN